MRTNKPLLILTFLLLFLPGLRAQEENPFVVYDIPSQNLLKFNRFLINPTFSTVREDKSYINLFHRNQSVSFDDNNQVYFLSYSGRVSDRSGVGLSLFTNREGLFNNFGVHANYAYGIRLSPKSNFTFGANISYYQSSFNQDRANALDNDPFLNSLESSSLVLFQPGFNLSFGNFDFGGYAENLFDYNLKSSESVTEFNEKTFSGHLQYTHQFKNAAGILEQGRLMPLARARVTGQNGVVLGGNLILDLPKLGWIQAGYDDFYGASAGLGFNLNKNLSIGYTVEKGLSSNFENFGVSHEVSLAYSFTPNLTENRVLLEDELDLVSSDSIPQENLTLTEKDLEIAKLKNKLAENDAILDELLLRQDSMEQARVGDLEKRFETVMKMVRRETRGERPDLEEKAKQVYFANMDSTDIISKRPTQPLANHGLTNTTAAKKVIRLNDSKNKAVTRTTTVKKDKTTRTSVKKNTRFRPFNIPNVESGHYLIANVFKNPNNADAFVAKLQSQKYVGASQGKRMRAVSLDTLSNQTQEGDVKTIKMIIKADAHGSIEALETLLHDIESEEVSIQILHSETGAVTENDIMLAKASDALVINFGMNVSNDVQSLANSEGVALKSYTIIYKVLDDVSAAFEGLKSISYTEQEAGMAEIQAIYSFSKVGKIAGCMVKEGAISRKNFIRVIRDGKEIYDGPISSLKRFKEDAKEVKAGYECGIVIDGCEDLKVGDQLQAYDLVTESAAHQV